ncbi:MAG: Rieske 2Fe-2S domain-containing protein [Hyphomicrobiales bacterium]|nr:Rieske 2Fe-2S domain-containing protein [Hyphomicrobiales bacterium]
MITAEENDILTQVGPGTPMGRMMRRYWHPVCASSQIAQADSAPVRVRMFGENYIVFRNSDGVAGILDEYCMHRRASLAVGRVEDNGIRCLYHGWKFGVDGAIQETPNHCDDRFKARQKAPAYPCREAGGLVWGYFGPKDKQPVFQRWGFFDGPDENRVVVRINTAANYLQLWEGGCDSSHVGILHCNRANPSWKNNTFEAVTDEDYNPGALSVGDNAPDLEVENTAFGYHYAAKRQGPAGEDGKANLSIRVTPVVFPTGRIIPAPAFQFFVYEVPQDDHKTSTYIVVHGSKPVDRSNILRILGLDDERFWREDDCEFRATWDDRLGQNRSAMHEDWSGFSGIEQEDAVIAISMGPIVERHKEVLVAADMAVVRLRERLLESVALNEAGKDPYGLTIADYSPVHSLVDTVIGPRDRWQDLCPGNMASGSMASGNFASENMGASQTKAVEPAE